MERMPKMKNEPTLEKIPPYRVSEILLAFGKELPNELQGRIKRIEDEYDKHMRNILPNRIHSPQEYNELKEDAEQWRAEEIAKTIIERPLPLELRKKIDNILAKHGSKRKTAGQSSEQQRREPEQREFNF